MRGRVTVVWHNAGDKTVEAEIHARMLANQLGHGGAIKRTALEKIAGPARPDGRRIGAT